MKAVGRRGKPRCHRGEAARAHPRSGLATMVFGLDVDGIQVHPGKSGAAVPLNADVGQQILQRLAQGMTERSPTTEDGASSKGGYRVPLPWQLNGGVTNRPGERSVKSRDAMFDLQGEGLLRRLRTGWSDMGGRSPAWLLEC